jgi:hypothetical protein
MASVIGLVQSILAQVCSRNHDRPEGYTVSRADV